MADWLTSRPNPKTTPTEPARRAPGASQTHVPLDALAGPQEIMEAAGFTNRGSITYHTLHHGFPAPVKQLAGIRLWDMHQVREWIAATED